MKLPHGDRAIVDIDKLVNYCLSFEHARGRNKARRFRAALGISADHATELRAELIRAASESNDAKEQESDRFGRRFVIDFVYKRGDRSASVRSGWIIRTGESNPRLTTCYVIGEP